MTCTSRMLLFVGTMLSLAAHAAVVEYYNPALDHYFITGEPAEQAFIDTGAVGPWQRTGNAFAAGGKTPVCRFFGNDINNPATGAIYGPNSHFYTADAGECSFLKSIYAANEKSWKFESNDFLTTPATGGSCSGNLTPVYRAYNNGFANGIDSNHRITSNQAAYQQMISLGWKGEGVVMCAPSPKATAVGTVTGSMTQAMVGVAGGTVQSADGRLALTIPAGALAGDAMIGIQPITNTAHGKAGAAYRLTPDGLALQKPIKLSFAYDAQDFQGSAAEFLGVAFQTPTGFWQWAGTPVIDGVAKTVSLATTHFSDWSLTRGVQIRPPSKTVKPKQALALQVKVCYDPGHPDPRGYACDDDEDQPVMPTLVSEWSVNSVPGGTGATGIVTGAGAAATYVAPAVKPSPNIVDVGAKVTFGASSTVHAVITIEDGPPSYIGTVHFSTTFGGGISVDNGVAEITWTQFEDLGDVRRYKPSGTIRGTMQWAGCSSFSAVSNPMPADVLVVYTQSNVAFAKSYFFTLNGEGKVYSVTCDGKPTIRSEFFVINGGGCGTGIGDLQNFNDEAKLEGTYACGVSGTMSQWSFIAN